jgi:predicted amidohydrolase YtcJ
LVAQRDALLDEHLAAAGERPERLGLIAVGHELAEAVDLDGAAAVPGLIDSHMHPLMGAIGARGADLLDAHTLDDVPGALAAERAKCAPGDWVRGWGLDYNVFEQTGISAEVIDEAVDGSPAALTFMDFHTLLVSSAALQVAGVDGPRSFAEHAEVVWSTGGRPASCARTPRWTSSAARCPCRPRRRSTSCAPTTCGA